MRKTKTQDTWLMLFGITALVVYVLACRPSFSPDGTKVVFPIMDVKSKSLSVALYDLRKKHLSTVFISALPAKEEYRALSVQWLSDGKQIAVNSLTSLLLLPVGSSLPVRYLPFEEALDPSSLQLPAPIIGPYQFLLSKTTVQQKNAQGEMVASERSTVLRINLETLETVIAPWEMEGYLSGNGRQLFYLAKAEIGNDDTCEVGTLDPEKLSKTPIYRFSQKEHGEVTAFTAINKSGNLIAVMTKSDDGPRILLLRGNRLEKTVPVRIQDRDFAIGNAEWSADERTLYLAYVENLQKESQAQYGVMEVPVDGGNLRVTPLFRGKAQKDDSLILFQIALSSDGRRIAATSLCLADKHGVVPEDRALYLVDLGSSKRQFTKVTIPSTSAPVSADARK